MTAKQERIIIANPGSDEAVLISLVDAQRKEIERLRSILKPFAEAERLWMDGGERVEIRMDWLTAAREAIDEYKPVARTIPEAKPTARPNE